jgi:tetratricopeptide (TPR) repeat protein
MSSICPRALVVAGLLACLSPAILAEGPDSGAFEDATSKWRTLMQQGRFDRARKLIHDTLAEHREQVYVRIRKAEIIEDLTRCAFGEAHPAPDPKDLVSGDLVSWNERTGQVKLRYADGQLQDFAGAVAKDGSALAEGYIVHPALFDGAYSVEVVGKRYAWGSGLPVMAGCIEEDEVVTVVVGQAVSKGRSYAPARIYRSGELVAEKDSSPAHMGKPYRIKMTVDGREVAGYYNGLKVINARRPSSVWGRIGLAGLGDFDQVYIQGKIQPSWLQGLVSRAQEKDRVEFEKTYRVEVELPPWLLTGPSELPVATNDPVLPGMTTEEARRVLDPLEDYLGKDKLLDGLDYVKRLGSSQVSEAARQYLLARVHEGLENWKIALAHCDKVLAEVPDFFPVRSLRARLLLNTWKRSEALAEHKALYELDPDRPDHIFGYALAVLLEGRPAEAKETIDQAHARGTTSKDLQELNDLLIKALRGPAWAKTYEWESRNYRVVSDIDRKTCVEAANLLEECYRGYTIHLQRVADLEKRKFTVYLFSGSAGFHAYAAGTTGPTHPYTLGLYSSTLKQLLIWNLPDRDTMMKTVRHEGFHQYLDRITGEAPRWLNEGLAEYYELAGIERGNWKEGQVDRARIREMMPLEDKLLPLADLLSMGPKEFYSKFAVTYFQSWAFIHFLRHSTRENATLFDEFFRCLVEGMTGDEASEKVFGKVDLEKLEREMMAYLEKL